MTERLGNVLYWLGCIIATCVAIGGIILFYFMLTGGNTTDRESAPLIGGLVIASALIPLAIGRACRYVLSGY